MIQDAMMPGAVGCSVAHPVETLLDALRSNSIATEELVGLLKRLRYGVSGECEPQCSAMAPVSPLRTLEQATQATRASLNLAVSLANEVLARIGAYE